MPFSRIVIDGTALTRANFTDPPKEMGILPFWFWNGELNENEMDWQMRQYHDRGIRGLFLHGRFGLKVPYLSEGWFERTKFVVEKAKDIGLDIWIYDEMNWPSGTAERQVLKKYPHLKQRYLELVVLHVQGPLFTFLEATDDRYVNTGDSNPIAAYACSAAEFDSGSISNLIDLTPNLSFNAVVPWEAPAGDWKLLYFLEKKIDYYIDALNPESTKKFLEITHEGYKKAVGKDFGTIVPGFYTDEPAMHYYHVGMDNYVIPWSARMFKIFRDRRGYDLKPYLPALYADMGDDTAKIRYDFWRTLSDQYTDSYYKQIRDWCDENGVIFTGHLLFEEWLRASARCEGNIFNHLKQMHLTGVDHLYPKIGTPETPDQHVAIKLASSAAHHFGSARLLCESMGGTYWDCTLERMKWMANWEYVLGVTIFNNHGYHYSIEGERKRDWPPSQFYHHTWWKYYDQFTIYMSRLGHILSGGRHVAKVLMLYPLHSVWTNYVPQSRTAVGNVIEHDFYWLTDALLRLHFDHDYADEDILAAAEVRDGKLHIRDEAFSVLILPPLTHIKASAFEKIKEFVAAGGSVIADTLIPHDLLEYEGDDAEKRLSTFFDTRPGDLQKYFAEKGKFSIQHRNPGGNIFVLKGRGLSGEKPLNELRKVIEQCITPDVTISDADVFYLHRIKDDFDLYFMTNTSQEDKGPVTISFETVGRPEIWNANTGEMEDLHVYNIRDGRLHITLNFPASESHVVIINKNQPAAHISTTNLMVENFDGKTIRGYSGSNGAVHAVVVQDGKNKKIEKPANQPLPAIDLGKTFRFTPEDDNVLLINHWKMKVLTDDDLEKLTQPGFADQDWLDVTMGAWEMQLPQERDEATYPETLCYRTTFNMEHMPGNTRLLIDGFSGSSYRLFINGKEVKDQGRRARLDAEMKEVDIESYLKKGRNTVAVRLVVERRTDGMLDLLKIIGDFALAEKDGALVIVRKPETLEVGDWTKQGFPFYSGTGVYRTEVEIPAAYLNGKLFLKAECGEDVLEIVINGTHTKIIPWHPYTSDITGLLKEGKNTIELKVTNTLINILEAVRHKSGLSKNPVIEHAHLYELSV